MARLSLILLLALQCIILSNVTGQSIPDHPMGSVNPVAVSIEEIKAYGIVVHHGANCNDSLPVFVFSDPELTQKIGSLASGSFVKYDRLSELVHKPYWAPRPQHALPDGEKFRIYHDSISGWVDDNDVMTFTSSWRDHIEDKLLFRDANTIAVIYSSGQNETSECVSLCVWERQNFENLWKLSALRNDSIPTGYLTLPTIEQVLRYDIDKLAILVSSNGGDAEDHWGTQVIFLLQQQNLSIAYAGSTRYSMDRDFTSIDCKLSLNVSGHPNVFVIKKQYVVTDTETMGYSSTLAAADTTIVNLLKVSEPK